MTRESVIACQKMLENGEPYAEVAARYRVTPSKLRNEINLLISQRKVDQLRNAINSKNCRRMQRVDPRVILKYKEELVALHLEGFIKLEIKNDIDGIEYFFKVN